MTQDMIPQRSGTAKHSFLADYNIRHIFVAGLIVRLVYAVVLAGVGQIHGDEYHYNHFAQALVGIPPNDNYEVVSTTIANPTQTPWIGEGWLLRRMASASLLGIVILALTSGSVNAPLMFYWIGAWYIPFGYHPIIYRLVSAIISSLSVIVLYKIGTELGMKKSGVLIACLLFALTPLGFQYSGTFYKEVMLGFLFLCAIYFLVVRKTVWLLVSLVLLTGFRANLLIIFCVFAGVSAMRGMPHLRKSLVRVILVFLCLGFFVKMPELMHRSLVGLLPFLHDTALLSKIPTFGGSIDGEILTMSIFGLIGLLQPIPFLYTTGGINYLSVMWNLCALNWAIVAPFIFSTFVVAYKVRNKVPVAYYAVPLGILLLILSGYGVAGPESVRYRDTIYPLLLLLVGWGYSIKGHYVKRKLPFVTFYSFFGIATAYAILKLL